MSTSRAAASPRRRGASSDASLEDRPALDGGGAETEIGARARFFGASFGSPRVARWARPAPLGDGARGLLTRKEAGLDAAVRRGANDVDETCHATEPKKTNITKMLSTRSSHHFGSGAVEPRLLLESTLIML